MCGICGYSGVDNYNEDKIKALLLFNQERGEDSLGYYTPNNEIFKKVGKPVNILRDSKYNTLPEGKFFMGHTRAATKGVVSEKNAHPFKSDNIILVMNGTLSNDVELGKEAGLDLVKYDVDSEILTALLSKAQSKEPLTKILGGCAIIYTDTNSGLMYCYRNSERPLYRGKLGEGMYISSIKESLEFIKCEDIKEFKQDVLYTINDGKILNTIPVKRAVEVSNSYNNLNVQYPTRIYKSGMEFIKLNFISSYTYQFKGLYLQVCKNPGGWLGGEKNITPGKVYQIIGDVPANNYQFTIKSDIGTIIQVSKHIFEDSIPFIKEGSYIYSLTDLSYKSKKRKDEEFCTKKDPLLVLKIEENTYDVKNIRNNKTASVEKMKVRPLYPEELNAYVEDLFDETDNDTPVDIILPEHLATFKDQLDILDFETLEDVADFMVDSIETELINIDENNKNESVNFSIDKIKVLLDFYTEKKGVLNA